MKVSWFSAGVSSFIACYLERKTIDKMMYIHIDDQHEDTMRFLKDCETALGKEIEILQSPYLDELAPDRGRFDDEVMEECSIFCQMILNE